MKISQQFGDFLEQYPDKTTGQFCRFSQSKPQILKAHYDANEKYTSASVANKFVKRFFRRRLFARKTLKNTIFFSGFGKLKKN